MILVYGCSWKKFVIELTRRPAPRLKDRPCGRSKRLSCRFVIRASKERRGKNSPSTQTVSRLTRYLLQCSAVLKGSVAAVVILAKAIATVR